MNKKGIKVSARPILVLTCLYSYILIKAIFIINTKQRMSVRFADMAIPTNILCLLVYNINLYFCYLYFNVSGRICVRIHYTTIPTKRVTFYKKSFYIQGEIEKFQDFIKKNKKLVFFCKF